MRPGVLALAMLVAPAAVAAGGPEGPAQDAAAAAVTPATREGAWSVRAGDVRVVVPAAELVPYARELAGTYARAARVAAAFWEVPVPSVTVVVDAADDVFNAYADPVNGPSVHVRLRGAIAGGVGLDARAPAELLAVHEMIHVVHFAARPGSVPVPTGLVGGDLPWPPPSWLLEGVAVWAESRLAQGGGGRLDAPDARGVLRVLAAEGEWPSLHDASLATHQAWPGGRVRYLLGGAFVDALIRRAGLPALRAALREFETQPPWLGFAHAWRRTTGGDLAEAWEALRAELVAEAEGYETVALPALGVGADPVRSPSGRRLAWRVGRTLHVGPWPPGSQSQEATLTSQDAHTLPTTPSRATWWGPARLVYARVDPRPDRRLRELFVLDLAGGEERRLTRGARAYFPSALPGGCVAFVRDDEAMGASIARVCEGSRGGWEHLWRAPAGTRIAGMSASVEGRLAVVLMREGRATLGVMDALGPGAEVRPVASPPGALREPVWVARDAVQVRSDASGAFESWRVDVREGSVVRLTATLGGVVGHGRGVAAVRRAGDPRLARLPSPDRTGLQGSDGRGGTRVREAGGRAGSAAARVLDRARRLPDGAKARVAAEPVAAPYRPEAAVRPIGWLPSRPQAGTGLGATAWASEPTGRFAVTATIGATPTARGPWGPVYAGVAVHRGDATPFGSPGRPSALRARLRLGLLPYAPHLGSALGPVPRLDATVEPVLHRAPTVRLRVEAGLLVLPGGRPALRGAGDLAAGSGRVDAWGVPIEAWTLGARARLDPRQGGGTSAGAWLDVRGWTGTSLPGRPVASGSLRAGWRPPPAVPRGVWGDLAATAAASLRWTVPVRARVAGGRLALERLRLEPGVRGSLTVEEGVRASWGVEGTVVADLVLGYGAPVSLAVRGGVAGEGAGVAGWVGVGLPLTTRLHERPPGLAGPP